MRDLSIQSVEVELDLLLCGAPCCQTKHHSSITSPRLSAPISLHRAFCGETRKIPETQSPRLLLSPISSRPSAPRETVCIPLSKLIARVNTTAGFLLIRFITVFYPPSSHVPCCSRLLPLLYSAAHRDSVALSRANGFPQSHFASNSFFCVCRLLTLDRQ
jgi:hypothetical protein